MSTLKDFRGLLWLGVLQLSVIIFKVSQNFVHKCDGPRGLDEYLQPVLSFC